jgi:hypothetical protein
MSLGISDLAHCIRKNSAATVLVPLGHAHQLVAAAFGYKSFAAYQAAQAAAQEPADLTSVWHVVPDYGLLDQRASELAIAPAPSQLHTLLHTALQERASQIRIHASLAAFEEYLREHVDQIVLADSQVIGEMANANHDGVDEVYFGEEIVLDKVLAGDTLEMDVVGHVGLGIDTERPYAGHKVNVECALSVARPGRQCFGVMDCQVIKAELDWSWADGDFEDGPRMRSESEAYAELLGLDLREVGDLVNVEAQPRSGHSGDMIYSYILDFSDHASPEVAEKILRRHSSLRIEVGPGFFDGVRSDDWPR